MRKRIIKNKLLSILILIVILSFILGALYISIISKNELEIIRNHLKLFFKNLTKLNYNDGITNSILTNIIPVLLIFIFSISIIGIPVILIILIYKSFVLGFNISSIIYFYKLKGILIALIYVIPLIINLLSIFIISYYGIIVSKKLIKKLIIKNYNNISIYTYKYIKLIVVILILQIINTAIEVFIIPSVLNLLQI